MTNFKRFVSGILSLVMMLVMFESIPVYAKTGTETYTYEGYTVEYIVSNEWTGNQSVEVKITNTGEESILNWALKYDAKGEVSGLWNAVSVSNEGNAYLIKNSGYNYEIAPNGSVSFGYTLSGENLSVPDDFELCSKRVDTNEENYTSVLNITEEWDTGFKGELVVSNVSDSPIEAWRFSFDSNFTVSDIWDCRLLENTDGRYTVASEAWINPIQPGSSVTIGIVGIKEEGKAPEISGVTLSEVVIDDTLPEVQKPVGEMFIAAFGQYIKETESIDILWMSTQTEGTFEILMSDDNEEYTVAGSVQNADNYSIPADFVKKYIKVRQTNGNQTAESEPFVVMMTPTGYTVDFIDSDNDGLYDYIEDAVGTDKNLSDTDSDDLSDYEEVYLLGTDPVVYDSIVSGTSDGNADPDNDGLSNRYELDNGTNPLYDDTDSDGLTDGEEVNRYGTNPLEPDTDFDGLEDSDEIYLGTDPTLPDTDNDGILDCDERFNQTFTHIVENEDCVVEEVIVSMEGTGNLQTNTTIESVMDKDVLCSEVVGLVGEPFSIETTSQFDIASLTFKIDQSKLGDTEFDNLMFLWYDEENYKFVELETFYDYENSTVSIETTHFSRYMIVDKFKWFEAWSVEFNYRPTDGVCKSNDTIITIDCSGSMYNYDTTGINSKRAQAASNFFDTMRDGDRAGVVTFTNSAEVTCNLTDSQTDLANGLDNIYSSGGTNFSAALNTALTVFDEDDTLPINKRIILLSDGQDSVPYAVLDECNERNVVVYTIGLGSSSDSILETIATYTGGEFFKAYTADELLDIYSDIGITSDFDTTDTDGDGLYDAVESAGIRLQNGKIINTDPTNSDSDDDGLSDGKEIDPKIRQFYASGMSPDVAALQPYYFAERSDPNNEDTDEDGSTDDMDIYPLVYDEIPLEFRKMYFKGLISKEKIHNTDDGFYIYMDSIESILEKMKCDIMDNSVGVPQRKHFDDWYFYAVKNSEDYAYSIVKLREIGDLDANDASNTYGVAVPFCEFDMDEFNYCNHNYDCNCDYATQSTIDSLHKVTVGDGKCSKTLSYYFGDVESEGSYLIGELYIQKLIDESFANSNTVKLEQKPKFLWEKLLSMPSYQLRQDYFNPPETITINDKSNLSNEERRLLIRYSLGSSSLNSFAAEIQAHAIFTSGADANSYELEKIKKEMALNPMINYGPQFVQVNLEDFITEEIIKHGIKADISYGEETFSAITVFLYLEDWSYYTQKQIEEHGIII